jgi:hypothetical protein
MQEPVIPEDRPPAYNPTEVISTISEHDAHDTDDSPYIEPPAPVEAEDRKVVEQPVEPAPPKEITPSQVPPPPPPVPVQESDRRTIVMADQSQSLHKSKGRIVGWLITYSRDPDGQDYRIYAGHNRIGANPVCDVVLEDETVSGSHAIIVYRDGRCLIKDDLSRNGTFVNGREITESHNLQSYDQIRLGNTYLTFIAAQRSSQ